MSSKQTKLRIALAQNSPINGPEGTYNPETSKDHPFASVQKNLDKATEFVASAAKQGADVVVFPEYFLQGIVNEGRQYLCLSSDHLTAHLQDLAKKHNISIVGTIVHGKLPSSHSAALPSVSPFTSSDAARKEWVEYLKANPPSDEQVAEPTLHNTAFFIDENGRVLGEYIKKNLWHPERDYLTAGEESHEVFDTKWGKAGFLICWDISHPAAAQSLTDKSVDIVFCPIYWLGTDSEPAINDHEHDEDYERQLTSALCFARAFETETVWIMCNAGGNNEKDLIGGSGVWAPLRGRLGGFDGSDEAVKPLFH
ncbi:carbon-nitrogen hydrolase [Kockovaella imperatae]|uniref:Carbon-nitrogen hydrolase n=1 Tax=Kockovaella imperatae TaxID=4999 RepID=A0A1Y1USD4_9TREE|nr:carbon-nitrogen hydrolase [Kockovaella imperatae]ORX40909.1 carbon-nitrogen hydrolase [Kockovaella imperatae]